jgi:hypothetical protein
VKGLAKGPTAVSGSAGLNASSLTPEQSFLESTEGGLGFEPIEALAYVSKVRGSQGQGPGDNSS